jgi:hypothetical protein
MIFLKKYFVFTVGSACRVKRLSLGGKGFVVDEEVEMVVRKWQSRAVKRLLCCGFRLTGKMIDWCIGVGGGYVKE